MPSWQWDTYFIPPTITTYTYRELNKAFLLLSLVPFALSITLKSTFAQILNQGNEMTFKLLCLLLSRSWRYLWISKVFIPLHLHSDSKLQQPLKLLECNSFFYYCYFPNTIFFSTVQHGDPVTHTCIHNFFPIVVLCCKYLDIVLSATQQDLIVNPLQKQVCIH